MVKHKSFRYQIGQRARFSLWVMPSLRRQISQILKQRLPAAIPKFGFLLGMLLLVPVLFGIRLLRPFVLIRFGSLRADRIGDFTFHTEVYLCGRDAGIYGRRTLDLFYFLSRISNHQLKKMWKRTIHVYAFVSWLDRLNRRVPGGEAHISPITTRQFLNRDIHGLLARFPPHLSFTPAEERRGQEDLLKLGVPAGETFVCFMTRDPAYLDSVFPEIDWTYQNHRDASINNHVFAAEELTNRGHFALRMGAVVNEKLNSNNPMVIDYATNFRTDFLDMYLGSKCRFLLSTDCGYVNVPQVFRRPIAWTNIPAIELIHTWMPNQLFIPKKLWHKIERRFLTFQEVLNSGVGRLYDPEEFDKLGIELIENTPEEISALALEMDDRLSGRWQDTDEDEDNQRRFRELFAFSELHGCIVSRIGTEFLRQNRDLL